MLTYQNGVMPTDEWFEKIKGHVDFKGKRVFDAGCAEGVMSLLALKEGAKEVIAIDNQPEMVEATKFLTSEFKNIKVNLEDLRQCIWGADITILSMIIHWIGKQTLLNNLVYLDNKQFVIIFREHNPGYQIPINGEWFPTLQELHSFMEENGFKRIHSEVLMQQDNQKRISLAIYDRKKG